MAKVDFSLILPCYNEGPTFAASVKRIVNVLNKTGKKWEVIFVEDRSTDETRDSVENLHKSISGSRVIYHKQNLGRGRCVADGIRAAKYDICGYIDVDLEVPAAYIPLFIKEVAEGHDLVVGKRYYEGGLRSFVRVLLSKVYAFAVKIIVKLPIDDTEAGYKFFKRSRIVKLLPKIKSKHWFWDTEICAVAHWQGLKISQVPVMFVRRPEKKSTVRLASDTIDYVKNLMRLKFDSGKINV